MERIGINNNSKESVELVKVFPDNRKVLSSTHHNFIRVIERSEAKSYSYERENNIIL